MKTLLLKIKAKNLLFFITLFLGFFILNSCKQNEEEIKISGLSTNVIPLKKYYFRLIGLQGKGYKNIEIFSEKNKNPLLLLESNQSFPSLTISTTQNIFSVRICNTLYGKFTINKKIKYTADPTVSIYLGKFTKNEKFVENCPDQKRLAIQTNLGELLKNTSKIYYISGYPKKSPILELVSENNKSIAFFVKEE